MTVVEFKNTPRTLPNWHPILKALWYDTNNNWHAAHDIAQSKEGTQEYDRLHAYLHRKEGDNWNANYWYKKARTTMPSVTIEEEWEELVRVFL